MAGAARLVAVTGATGFLGRRLVPILNDRGWRVRALVRRSAEGLWGAATPELVGGNLAQADALAELTRGADAVIHTAGLIKAAGRAAFFDVNEAGARRLALAAADRRTILISSLAAREPALSDYAASKRAGETAARAVLGDRLMVLRPPVIFGPGDRETLGLFRAALVSPVMPLPARPDARLALAHVDDVAADIADALEAPWTPGVFAFGGARPEGYGWREIFNTAAEAVGRSPALVPVPGWLIGAAGAASEAAARLRGEPAIFTRGKARELLHADWSVHQAEERTGRSGLARSLRAGFDDTVAWYRREGWLT